MDNKTNTFQIVLISVFALCIVAGMIIFSAVRSKDNSLLSPVVLWGTVPKASFEQAYAEINAGRDKKSGKLQVTYVEIRPEDFDRQFIESLAADTGPDAVIITQDLLLRHLDKLYTLSFESFPLRDFKDSYIDEAELFLVDEGIAGLPFFVDPLVLYWNKDIFASAGLSLPPKLWSEFFTLAPLLTKKDARNNIVKSTIALGEFENVNNAKEIISALFLQAGSPIVRKFAGEYESALGVSSGLTGFSAADSALGFYTEFSNPNKVIYTWNKSLPESKKMFLAGDLAVYLGFASEAKELRLKNPNLNFDISILPQPNDAKTNITFGNLYAFAALKSSKNIAGTFQSLFVLSDSDFVKRWSEIANLPPTRRDLLALSPKDPDLAEFYKSALFSKAWLDPEREGTRVIFKNLVDSISSGRLRISDAVTEAGQEMDNLLNR